jgi:hypothetical protein
MVLFTNYTYTPNIASELYLPLNGDPANFVPQYTGLSGLKTELPLCYDKYGVSWKWNQFTCNTFPFSAHSLSAYQFIYPSTWNSVKCGFPGVYPKKWKNEGANWTIPPSDPSTWASIAPESAFLFSPNPLPASASPIFWSLSSESWGTQNNTFIPPDVSQKFPFNLRFYNIGGNYGTVSYLEDTVINLKTNVTISEIDTRVIPFSTNHFIFSNTVQITAFAPPIINLYTTNKYILTGVRAEFENLTTRLNLVSSFTIDYEDGVDFFFDPYSNFNITFKTPGTKTLKISANSPKWKEPIIASFPEIVTVLPIYDEISLENYRDRFEEINLPHPNPPTVKSNDWTTNHNINFIFDQFLENINYLETLGKFYNPEIQEYYGYLGPDPDPNNLISALSSYWSWNLLEGNNPAYNITWKDTLTASNFLETGSLTAFGRWQDHEIVSSLSGNICDDIRWHVNITNKIDSAWPLFVDLFSTPYDQFRNASVRQGCIYKTIFSKNNVLYLTSSKEIKILNKDKNFNFNISLSSFDGVLKFENVVSCQVDNQNRIYVLDRDLLQVGVYTNTSNIEGMPVWSLITNWGGIGGRFSKNSFIDPNYLYVDHQEFVWVSDVGSNSLKHFTNSGGWIKTLSQIENAISLTQDSQNNIHVLTNKNIQVYSYSGEFLFNYDYNMASNNTPRQIASSYNKEIIYVVFEKEVAKFFRNGAFCGLSIKEIDKIENINGVFQDEYRNLLILSNDKILKYIDLMEKINNKGDFQFTNYWKPQDIYIHKNEFIQNWVYTKSFQRLWDNIEIFKNTLYYLSESQIKSLTCSDLDRTCNLDNLTCKKYIPPIHGKDKMIIGQNEIVTSAVVNRVLKYLWDNFKSIIPYFQNKCNP